MTYSNKEIHMQALIITAYQDKEAIKRNLEVLSKKFQCYIHLDKKSDLSEPKFLRELNAMKNVTAISRYKINWGSYLHMMAILDLMKMAVKEKEITRLHIISGEDFPVKSYHEFYEFFEVENKDKNFIELTDIRTMPVMKLRYEKFHFLHIFNRKSKNKAEVYLDKIIRQIQYHLPFKRKTSFDYKGLVWSSLSVEGAKQVIEYITPERVKVLKYTEAAEEFMVQNALINSPLEATIVTDNKRYDDWSGCLTGPKVLRLNDYDNIKASGAFFARKIQRSKKEPEAKALYKRLYEEFVLDIQE